MHQCLHHSSARGRRQKGTEKIFEEIIVEDFPNMGKKIVNQIQEAESLTGETLGETL